jgi:hypothetical protein
MNVISKLLNKKVNIIVAILTCTCWYVQAILIMNVIALYAECNYIGFTCPSNYIETITSSITVAITAFVASLVILALA